MRVTMLLADAAQEVNGKLYVLGGGWSVTGPDLPPMAIAIKLDVPWSAANAQHAFALELVDEDGRAVPAGDSGGGVRAEGSFEVGRPAGLPGRQRHRLRLRGDDPAVPDRPGRYSWRLSIDERDPRGLGAAVPGAGPGRDREASPSADVGRRARPALRPALGRRTGTPSGWSPATPTSRYAGCCSPSTRSRPSSTRPSRGARTCSSPTTRCCCAAVHSVATTHPKGRAVTALVRAGVALHVAHTNADVADPGVSDALADRARADRPPAAAAAARRTRWTSS